MADLATTRSSIKWRLLSTMIGLIVALLLAITLIQINAQQDLMTRELQARIKLMRASLMERGQALTTTLAHDVESDLAAFNLLAVTQTIEKEVGARDEISFAILMDSNGIAYVHTLDPTLRQKKLTGGADVHALKQKQPTVNELNLPQNSVLEFIVPIQFSVEPWGVIRVAFSMESLSREIERSRHAIDEEIRTMIWTTMFTSLVIILIGIGIVLWMAARISNPIVNLTLWAERVAHEDITAPLEETVAGPAEVKILARSITAMARTLQTAYRSIKEYSEQLEDKVASRTAQLSEALETAETAIEKLSISQEQLIQSEKMASLGQLVAGVAHEINTPIGVALTAASYLEEATNNIVQKIESNQLTKADFLDYSAETVETSSLILRNLERTADLVSSFKMVSADRTNVDLREFDLSTYMEEVIRSLGPQLKKSKHSVHVDCEPNIHIRSYPGALAQVVTNLLMNSLVHAYDPDDAGKLEVQVGVQDEKVVARFSDDGRGIPPENLPKIFDPFFTTRRGAGGTGLGLHVVYNTVHQTLGGEIVCKSEVGVGTTFLLTLPMVTGSDPIRQLHHG